MCPWWNAINWNAVGAITSSGVLFWAIWEATAANRLRRQHDVALLRALNVIVLGTQKLIERRLLEGTDADASSSEIAQSVLTTGGLEVAQRSLDAMPLHMMPTSNAVDALMGARASVEHALAVAAAMSRDTSIPIMALAVPMNGLAKTSEKIDAEIVALRRPLVSAVRHVFSKRKSNSVSIS